MLIWTGPATLLLGVTVRSINITLAAGIVVVLAPLGGWLTKDTQHSRQAAVGIRLARLQANAPRPADVGWLLVALIFGLGALVGIPWSGIRFWRREAEPLIGSRISTDRTFAYLGAGATLLIGAWISISCSYLLTMGSWRRTCWGYRRQPPDTIESTSGSTSAAMSRAQFAASMASFAALALLLVGAMIVFASRVNW